MPDLLQPGAAVVCAAAATVLAVAAALVTGRRRRRTVGTHVAVANVAHAAEGARFRRAHRRYLAALALEAAALAAIVLALAVLVGRPASTRVEAQAPRSRDIMLCLDVSNSMAEVDSQVLDAFGDIVGRLDGDRVGLTIWSGSAGAVFPLTDDYELVEEQLAATREAIDTEDFDVLAVAYAGQGSSLIGDGLASCVSRFDRVDEDRHRSIVLATDNEIAGDPIVTLDQAVDFAAERKITLYSLAPPDWGYASSLTDLRLATERIGGSFVHVDDSTAAAGIVEQITATDGTETELPPTVVTTDQPRRFVVAGLIAAAALGAVSLGVRR